MDKRVAELGARITACDARSRCPGIERGILRNDVSAGVPPRGLLIRPPAASLESVGVVVLGLNPGHAGEAEKVVLHAAAKRDRTRLFDAIHAETISQMHQWPYWKRMDQLLEHLGLSRTGKAILAAELVFCECVRVAPGLRRKHPGWRAIRFCTDNYLNEVLAEVPSSALVICVGASARDWFKDSQWNETFRWAWVKHVTGARGAFQGMFDEQGKLKLEVTEAWNSTLKGDVRGQALSRTRRKKGQ